MAETTLPPRSAIPLEHTWNHESVFATPAALEESFAGVVADLEKVAAYQGHLSEGPAMLVEWLTFYEDLIVRAYTLFMYAMFAQSVNTEDEAAAALFGRAMGLFGRALSATAFTDPELLSIGQPTLQAWLQQEPRLTVYGHYVENLFRKQAHVRSAEVEELLGALADPFNALTHVADMLAESDLKFAPALTRSGETLPVAQSTIDRLLSSPDREARRSAWEHYADGYLSMKTTLAAALNAMIKQTAFMGHARRYPSALEAALFENNIPLAVYDSLIATFRKNLPTWHRYWRVRRRALGVETLHPYDIWAPLTPAETKVTYPQAVEWICQGMAPLGADYVETVRRGCLEERWVDIYPNQGKRQGAFSAGTPRTYPFIMMSFNDQVESMSTLAHELGHSMHSYYTNRNQPAVYSEYSMFVAEVASNFNQAMVRAHLLQTNPDRDFQIAVLEEAMSNFHRYLFIMPTLARFEREAHERIWRGESATAGELIGLMADLFEEGYGGEMAIDRDRIGITWAQFPHLYVPFYVFQYATGISAANALARRILAGEPGAAERYLSFLKAGGSVYPLDALKIAGVDMTGPQAVDEAFAVLSGLVDRLEALFP